VKAESLRGLRSGTKRQLPSIPLLHLTRLSGQNTIDHLLLPQSRVTALAAKQSVLKLPSKVAGTDPDSESQATPSTSRTTAVLSHLADPDLCHASLVHRPKGHTYSFYSIARDLVGNVEPAKTEGETSTQVLLNRPPIANAGAASTYECTALTGTPISSTGPPRPIGWRPADFVWRNASGRHSRTTVLSI